MEDGKESQTKLSDDALEHHFFLLDYQRDNHGYGYYGSDDHGETFWSLFLIIYDFFKYI